MGFGFNIFTGNLDLKGSGGGSSSPLTTKGDLYTYSTADARLGVGSNSEILIADSTQSTGLKWAKQGYELLGYSAQSRTYDNTTFSTVDIHSFSIPSGKLSASDVVYVNIVIDMTSVPNDLNSIWVADGDDNQLMSGLSLGTSNWYFSWLTAQPDDTSKCISRTKMVASYGETSHLLDRDQTTESGFITGAWTIKARSEASFYTASSGTQTSRMWVWRVSGV